MDMTSKQPVFSIVLPTYNRAAFVGKAIESVLGQTFDDFELIVVDDGRTDNTRDVVCGFADPRIKYYWKCNEERSIARNYGIGKASGRYLNFLDSDDRFYPDHLATAFRNLEEKGFPELVHTRYVLQDGTGNTVLTSPFFEKDVNRKLIYSNILHGGCFFISKVALGSLSFIPHRDANFSEDWYLWLRLAARFPIQLVNAATVIITEHDRRSLRTVKPTHLERALLLVVQELRKDPVVLGYYKKSFGYFVSECYSLIALHYVSADKRRSLSYLSRALTAYPFFPKRKRFWALLKNLLLTLNRKA